jgi:hypothetical protein
VDVRDVVDVSDRHVRRVLDELATAGYLRCVEASTGRASIYARVDDPSAGEVSLPERDHAVVEGGHSPTNEYYTWNVRVRPRWADVEAVEARPAGVNHLAPPDPASVEGLYPPT